VGDGHPKPLRNHAAFLYRDGGETLLVDCGEPFCRSYAATGWNVDLIDRILLSHLHFDHLSGLFMLLQGFWLANRRKELIIHMPEEGIQPVKQMLQAGYLFDELLSYPLRFLPWTTKQPVPLQQFRVTPHPTTHLEPLRRDYQAQYPRGFESFSFLLETDGHRLGHSADLGSPEDLAPLVTQPIDLLVCELAHFPPESLFNYLKGSAIQQLLLVHAAQEYWDNRQEIQRMGQEMLSPTRLSFPQDGEVFTFR
jgi:ribonuclease Z